MRTFLVTGGAGFIGSHIVEALVKRGDTVRVLDNLSTGFRENLSTVETQIELVMGDLTDETLVGQIMEGVDGIFHQAALASVPRSVAQPLDTHAACVTGTVNLLDKARRANVPRVVYAASSSAYGNQSHAAKRETNPPAPRSPYASAKLAGELYCHAFYHTYGLETVSLRYFNVFGPRQDPNSPYSAVIPLFITSILTGRQPTVYGDGLQSRDFTYVDNVVHGNLLAMDADQIGGRTVNVANGHSVSLLDLLASINQRLKTDVEPVHADPRPGDVRDSLADITLARQLLGYDPVVDFETGLDRSIDYYRSLAKGGKSA